MTHDPTRCPICGRPNGCAVAAGGSLAACWCRSESLPRALVETARGSDPLACVCRDCVAAHCDESPAIPESHVTFLKRQTP